MGNGFRRRIVLGGFSAALMAGMCAAQSPATKPLPDAPVPSTIPRAGGPEQARAKPQQGPAFSASLSVRQKYALAYRRIISLQMPLRVAFVSGWEVGTDTGPDFPTNGWPPFAERFGYNAASLSTTIFFDTAFVPAIAHQDPRYFPLGHGRVKRRIGWALRSEFVGVGDDGRPMPNYANLVGLGLSSMVIDAFTPRSSASFGDTVERYGIKLAVTAGMNVGSEFHVFNHAKALARHSRVADQ